MKNLRNDTMMKLEPIYDSHKSFYNKAWMSLEGNKVILYSYGTVATAFDLETTICDYLGPYTQTTSRHVEEFRKQMTDQEALAIENEETLRTRINHFFGIV